MRTLIGINSGTKVELSAKRETELQALFLGSGLIVTVESGILLRTQDGEIFDVLWTGQSWVCGGRETVEALAEPAVIACADQEIVPTLQNTCARMRGVSRVRSPNAPPRVRVQRAIEYLRARELLERYPWKDIARLAGVRHESLSRWVPRKGYFPSAGAHRTGDRGETPQKG